MTTIRSAGEFFRRAVERHRQGDVAGALADFEEVARLDPVSAEPSNNCGAMRRALGDLDGALADFEEAIRRKPDYAEALNNRGVIRLMRGDAGRALADFDEAVRLSPGYGNALCNRGVARRESGDLAGAVADFDAALRLDPGDVDAIRNRALARREAGDLAGAVEDLGRSLAVTPRGEAAGLHFDRAAAHLIRANWGEALADLDEALAIDPRYTEAYIYRGNVRHHRGDPLAFVDHFRGFRLDAALSAREVVEIVHWDVMRDAAAFLRACAGHLSRDPDDTVALMRRGVGLLLLDRAEEATADLDRAAAQGADHRACRAWVERAAGELSAWLRTAGGPDRAAHWLRKFSYRTGPRGPAGV